MDGVKIYGLCLERLKHQITTAKSRAAGVERVLLESYNTGDPEDIIDILELYDVTERTIEQVTEKLDDLAYTVSVLTREKLQFDFTDEGHIGLFLSVDAPVSAHADRAKAA
ncbi:MAG: hypothetical protein AB1553_10800 [Nitrospirota bacterium]